MGTRNLTMVVYKTKMKVAQYGQWDGNPSGQGATILSFLKKVDLEKFKENLKNVSFVTKKEMATWKGMDNDVWRAKYPHMSRDIGSEILGHIDGSNIQLVNQEEFASESLYNEWSYVVDLDREQLEVYKGFQTKPVPKGERFAKYNDRAEKESMVFYDYTKSGKKKKKGYKYYPIKLEKIYKFNNLPTKEQLIKDCDPEEK